MSPGGGELSLSVCPGVGNRTSSTQMPGGVPGGEMVTGRIEPRIMAKRMIDEEESGAVESFLSHRPVSHSHASIFFAFKLIPLAGSSSQSIFSH